MKSRLLILISAAALLLALAAGCKKQENYDNTSSSTTDTSMTDTSATTSTNDTSGTAGTSGTTGSPTTGTATGTGATGGTTSTLSNEDKEFVTKAAQGGMAEVNLGSMASQKGTAADVKTFGNRMVGDHGKANDELKQLATNKGLALPTDVDKESKEEADKLGKLSGAAFDKEYASDMVKDHEKDVKEFEKASKGAKDPDLKAWAAKTLPTLQDHLKMAKEMESKVKGGKA
jgi:putative membrane protein